MKQEKRLTRSIMQEYSNYKKNMLKKSEGKNKY